MSSKGMHKPKYKRKLFYNFSRKISNNVINKYIKYKNPPCLKKLELIINYLNCEHLISIVRKTSKIDIIKQAKEYAKRANITEDEKQYNYLLVKDLISHGISWHAYVPMVIDGNLKVEKRHIPYNEICK